MESEVRIVVVQLPSSLSAGGQPGGYSSFSLPGGTRSSLKATLEKAMNAPEPGTGGEVRYRTYLDSLEKEGVKGSRPINALAAVDHNRSIRPAPSPADVLLLELGYFDSGSILRATA